jgi:hypothetical protein
MLLRSPDAAMPVQATFSIPDAAPARAISLLLNDRVVAAETYAKPGLYTLKSAPVLPPGETATLTLMIDRTFSVAGDHRELGVILTAAGFLPAGP